MGRPIKEKRRYMGEDGLWYYKCYVCEQFCPEYDMTNNRNKPFGKDIYCSTCKKIKREQTNQNNRKILTKVNKQYGTSWIEPTGRHLNLKGATPEDQMITIEFFRKMNYDLSKPIHIQFAERIKEKYGVELEIDDTPYQIKEKKGL